MISRALLNAPFFIPKDADLLRNRKVNTKKRQNRHLPELAFLILGTYFTAPSFCFYLSHSLYFSARNFSAATMRTTTTNTFALPQNMPKNARHTRSRLQIVFLIFIIFSFHKCSLRFPVIYDNIRYFGMTLRFS